MILAPLVLWSVHFINATINNYEVFSKEELIGNKYTGNKPLVEIEADLTNNNYFNNKINPVVYDEYPIDGTMRITNRDVNILGVVPKKAIQIEVFDDQIDLLSSGGVPPVNESLEYRYMLPYYMYYDFLEIQSKVINKYIRQSSFRPRIEKIIWGQFPVVIEGRYDLSISYRIPGTSNPTSRVTIPMNLSYNSQ